MPGDSRLSARFGADTSDFKNGITEINREIKVLESGFRASASSLGDWSKDASGLESRINTLNGKISLQKEKVNALTVAYEQQVKAYGKNSIEAQNALIKLNNETEALGKNQTELRESKTALDGMGKESKTAAGKVDDLANKEDKASGKTKILSGLMHGLGSAVKVGVAAIASLAVGVAGMAVGIGALVLKTAQAGDDLDTMSRKTGLSTDRLQELQYIAKQTGTDLETMTGSMARAVRSMDAAQKAGSPAADAFAELGIKVTDSNGKLRDSKTVWEEALVALGNIPDETERDAVAMQIFGKSAQELEPLMQLGTGGMEDMATAAHKMGAVMSEENVKAAADLNDKIDSLKSGFQGIVMTLAGALVPGLSAAASGAQDFVTRLVDILGMMKTDPEGGKKLLTGLVSDIVSQIPQLLSAGMAIIQGLMTAIIGALPTLVKVAVQIITSFMTFLIQNIPLLINAGIEMIMSLVNGILPQLPQFTQLAMDMILNLLDGIFTMLPQLLTAAVQIIITLATGLANNLPKLMEKVAEFIPKMILTLVQALPLLIGAALQLIIALVNGLVIALPILIEYAPQIIQAIVAAMILVLPLIGDAAVQIILALGLGIYSTLPTIGKSGGEIVGVLIKGIEALILQLGLVGADMVRGIWEGVQGKTEWFRTQINGFFSSIIDGVKASLGIQSPSKVFAGLGQNMAAGLGVGFANQFRGVQNQINGAIAGLAGSAMNVNVNGQVSGGGAQSGRQAQVNLGGIHITINGGGNPQVVRQAADQGVRSALRATGLA